MRFLLLSLNIQCPVQVIDKTSLAKHQMHKFQMIYSIRLSQYQWQPANIWFKSTNLLHLNNEQDTETQVSTNEEEEKRKKMAISNNKGLTPFSNVQASGMKKFNAIPQGHGAPKAELMKEIQKERGEVRSTNLKSKSWLPHSEDCEICLTVSGGGKPKRRKVALEVKGRPR